MIQEFQPRKTINQDCAGEMLYKSLEEIIGHSSPLVTDRLDSLRPNIHPQDAFDFAKLVFKRSLVPELTGGERQLIGQIFEENLKKLSSYEAINPNANGHLELLTYAIEETGPRFVKVNGWAIGSVIHLVSAIRFSASTVTPSKPPARPLTGSAEIVPLVPRRSLKDSRIG